LISLHLKKEGRFEGLRHLISISIYYLVDICILSVVFTLNVIMKSNLGEA